MAAGILRYPLGRLGLAPFRTSLIFATVLALVAASAAGRAAGAVNLAARSPCQFQKSTSTVAFCDTFDRAAAANSTRSGALDPTVWGVSRLEVNPSVPGGGGVDVMSGATGACGNPVQGDNDVYICNGRLFDTVNDGGGQTVVAMYPRQPFDIAGGRTGDVTFDVSNNSQGGHGAWPAFAFTDQPVPAPYVALSGVMTAPMNGFGFSFDYVYNPAGEYLPNPCVTGGHTIGEVWAIRNGSTVFDSIIGGVNNAVTTGFGRWVDKSCINPSTSPTNLSHIEIQMSTSKVVVWGSNPGTSNLIELGELDNATLPLSRGLLWMEDAHYNGGKFGSQGTDTFGWDNFGFDGPVRPRDVAAEVPDRTQKDLGWVSGSTVTTLPASSTALTKATGALVEMNFFAGAETMPVVSVNGHAGITEAWPFGSQKSEDGYGPGGWKTVAYRVPVSELKAGPNTIHVTNAQLGFANVDVILQGAGGIPTCLDPSNCGAVSGSSTSTPGTAPTPTHVPTAPTPTAGSTPAPARSAGPTPTERPAPTPETMTGVPCSVTMDGRQRQGTCSGTFQPG